MTPAAAQHQQVLDTANRQRTENARVRVWFLRHKRKRQALLWRLRWQNARWPR
jgi:hypothetical protein